MNTYEDDEYQPPAHDRICRRALVFTAVACRSSLEQEPQHPASLETYLRLQKWILDHDLQSELEDYEKDAIIAPLGTLTPRQVIDFSWRSEGLAILGWALGRSEIPPHDEQADGPAIGNAIGFLVDGGIQSLVSSTSLREEDELWWLADLTLAVHWRLRQYYLKTEPFDFVEFASRCTWAKMPIEDLPIINGDLSIRGMPISDADENVLSECLSIAQERHQAANWLLGTEEIYSEVTCNT